MLTGEFTQKDLFLEKSQSEPNADLSSVKVATLSMTFQDWSRLRVLRGLSSLILTRDRPYAPNPKD